MPNVLLRRRLGRALIVTGVAVWLVWLVARLTGGEPEIRHYLPFHLCGVIPGAVLLRWEQIVRLIRR